VMAVACLPGDSLSIRIIQTPIYSSLKPKATSEN
jgi:hypothetical protein